MEIKQGYSYHIKDEFFDRIKHNNLMSNKENGSYRPHYYALQDENNKEIYWMIPISSRIDKYTKIYNDKVQKYGRCNTLLISEFSGRKSAFLLQNVFPIKAEYVDHIHIAAGKPVKVHKDIDFQLKTLLKELFVLRKRGVKVIFTDLDSILDFLKNN